MRTASFPAVALVALVAAGAAFAGNGNGNGAGLAAGAGASATPGTGVAAPGARRAVGMHYLFAGTLTATPANGSLSLTVDGGNRPALHAMLGQPVAETFAYGTDTEFLTWSQGTPAVVQPGDLAAGDEVLVHVRAPLGASLAQIEQQPAALVGDHGSQPAQASGRLCLFRGTLAAVSGSSVTLDVKGGNAAALRLLVGQQSSQTFVTGGQTIFLLWQGEVPTVISLSQLKVGDPVVVRIRADRGSTLAQVEATAATHVGDREPASRS